MTDERPSFYYDLLSVECYLVAERVSHVLAMVPVWRPVLASALGGVEDPLDAGRAEVERRAAECGLPELRWPDPWPTDARPAMRAAIFAKQAGRAVAFSLAAFRQAFAAGRDLAVIDNVLIAAAACELHPRAVLKAIESESVREALDSATNDAAALGVERVPAVVAGGEVFSGPNGPERAAHAIGHAGAQSTGKRSGSIQ